MAAASCKSGGFPQGEITVNEGEKVTSHGLWRDFILKGEAKGGPEDVATIRFASDSEGAGYEVVFHGGPIDGSLKTGSLKDVRNLYRSLPSDGEWFDFEISVSGDNIGVKLGGTPVVCYTEPDKPYRTEEHKDMTLRNGNILIEGQAGQWSFRNLSLEKPGSDFKNPSDTLPPVDEQTDGIIRLQQAGFPVIDYHVHLKGGLTKEQAHAKSMNYGINYGVAPNLGEGGVGRMLSDDKEAYDYFDEVKDLPFLCGAQGEGRRWIVQFSPDALGIFDYLFTDAMTIVDNKGRISRIYHPEEVHLDGMTKDQWMDLLVSQIEKILTNEPVDIYANATYIPEDMMPDYDKYWTPERVDRVLDVLQKNGIALEISARYKIPSFDIIRKAKARGLKFTFGTNNEKPDFGRLEYCVEAVKECGLEPSDIWFPSMSTRASRKAVNYNNF